MLEAIYAGSLMFSIALSDNAGYNWQKLDDRKIFNRHSSTLELNSKNKTWQFADNDADKDLQERIFGTDRRNNNDDDDDDRSLRQRDRRDLEERIYGSDDDDRDRRDEIRERRREIEQRIYNSDDPPGHHKDKPGHHRDRIRNLDDLFRIR